LLVDSLNGLLMVSFFSISIVNRLTMRVLFVAFALSPRSLRPPVRWAVHPTWPTPSRVASGATCVQQRCVPRVASHEPTIVQTFVEYGWRFGIEENFWDDKSNGFQLESSLVRHGKALARLCLVLAVTPFYLVAQGPHVVAAHNRRWFAPYWLRGNSYLRIGRQ
jgi:hypothetical protein